MLHKLAPMQLMFQTACIVELRLNRDRQTIKIAIDIIVLSNQVMTKYQKQMKKEN